MYPHFSNANPAGVNKKGSAAVPITEDDFDDELVAPVTGRRTRSTRVKEEEADADALDDVSEEEVPLAGPARPRKQAFVEVPRDRRRPVAPRAGNDFGALTTPFYLIAH